MDAIRNKAVERVKKVERDIVALNKLDEIIDVKSIPDTPENRPLKHWYQREVKGILKQVAAPEFLAAYAAAEAGPATAERRRGSPTTRAISPLTSQGRSCSRRRSQMDVPPRFTCVEAASATRSESLAHGFRWRNRSLSRVPDGVVPEHQVATSIDDFVVTTDTRLRTISEAPASTSDTGVRGKSMTPDSLQSSALGLVLPPLAVSLLIARGPTVPDYGINGVPSSAQSI